jgi:hypothetical protein
MQCLRTLACNPRVQAKLWPGLILAVFFVVSLLSMRHQTPTYDEGDPNGMKLASDLLLY